MPTEPVRKRGFLVEAGSRVIRALVAVPRWIAGLGRPESLNGPARIIVGLLLALVATFAAIVLVLVVARAIYYPFWAAGATHDALERSWGGPSAIGATIVHWLVAAVTVLIAYGLILGTERLSGGGRPRRGSGSA